MNRFIHKKSDSHPFRQLILSIAVLFAAILWLIYGSSSIAQSASRNHAESLRRAILRSSVLCYASEGRYPESLSYLKEHYGIDWNSEQYVVDYELTGSNRMPTVTVIPLGHKNLCFPDDLPLPDSRR